jgi:hypothetical protein
MGVIGVDGVDSGGSALSTGVAAAAEPCFFGAFFCSLVRLNAHHGNVVLTFLPAASFFFGLPLVDWEGVGGAGG